MWITSLKMSDTVSTQQNDHKNTYFFIDFLLTTTRSNVHGWVLPARLRDSQVHIWPEWHGTRRDVRHPLHSVATINPGLTCVSWGCQLRDWILHVLQCYINALYDVSEIHSVINSTAFSVVFLCWPTYFCQLPRPGVMGVQLEWPISDMTGAGVSIVSSPI